MNEIKNSVRSDLITAYGKDKYIKTISDAAKKLDGFKAKLHGAMTDKNDADFRTIFREEVILKTTESDLEDRVVELALQDTALDVIMDDLTN